MGSPSSKDKKPRARLASKGRGDLDKVGRRTEGGIRDYELVSLTTRSQCQEKPGTEECPKCSDEARAGHSAGGPGHELRPKKIVTERADRCRAAASSSARPGFLGARGLAGENFPFGR